MAMLLAAKRSEAGFDFAFFRSVGVPKHDKRALEA
jgi:hypothetical protein